MEFFTNSEQDQLLVSLWPGPRPSTTARLRERPSKHLPNGCMRSFPYSPGWGFLRGRDDALGRAFAHLHGLRTSLQASLGGFFQVNRFLLPELLQLAVEKRSGCLAWDLYSGAGLFARALDLKT